MSQQHVDLATYGHDTGWRRVIHSFTPAWFSVSMGTGITSILLFSLPYNIIFSLNVLYFVTFLSIGTLQYLLCPASFSVMIRDPTQSLFLGTFPIALATIVDMICLVCVPSWGHGAAYLALGLWMLDAALSVLITITVPMIVLKLANRITREKEPSLNAITGAWILPVVSPVILAATGGLLHSLGIWLPLPMMAVTIYLQRLLLHKLPPKAAITSVCIPLGPLGQGGHGIQKPGEVSRAAFTETHALSDLAGEVFYAAGFLAAPLMWACCDFHSIWAGGGTHLPLGVYAACTVQLGRELPSTVFNILGTVFSLCVLIIFIIVSFLTWKGVFTGSVFVTPGLKEVSPKESSD
ncbi:sulfite efflux pump SSU1 [Thelonectria olida]|uniref:Sulfite efflux pump SSU1 n=1 Tax=Thelonectria olida TaxID=1576542 RepID=A0A9P9AXS6_9HYPO|nr:sulfite efflux pump SSU1 [Thelonectria olida]